MSADYDVSVIIINYNGKKYIDELFSGLMNLNHDDFSYEIVFVDNASTDDSLEYLKKEYVSRCQNLVVVQSKENLGFAGGNNLGVANAHGKYIALLNNDTRPEPDWLESLYHYIKLHSDVVMVNSKLVFFYDYVKFCFYTHDKIVIDRKVVINDKPYYIDSKFCKNTLCEQDHLVCFGHTEIYLPLLDKSEEHSFTVTPLQCVESDCIILGETRISLLPGKEVTMKLTKDQVRDCFITIIQNAGSNINENLDGYDIGFCQEDGEQFCHEYELNSGCGGSIIFLKQDFVECGGFDERFFMYYEDTDLSYRMRKKGKIMYCPESIVRHVHAGSSGEWSPFFTYHVSKNKLLFVAKNYGRKRFLKYYFRQTLSAIKHLNRPKFKGSQQALLIIITKGIKHTKRECPHLI